MRPAARLSLALAVGVVLGMSCRFTFTDDILYSCKADADCGGGGFVCTDGVCCKKTGLEICGDKIDNDCDGVVDGDGVVEVCNGRDDDCDNATDEGFDLLTSPTNCGTCGTACDTATQACVAGKCERRSETDCGDGIDNDSNGQIDCADPGCTIAPCGSGCLCQNGAKIEQLCDDGVDNDGDGQADCADSECEMKACGAGCACIGGVRKETNCADGVDNDVDGGADCNDPACQDQFCLAGTTQRCMGTACLCNGGASMPEDAGVLCGDGLDNDCDNNIDCRDTGCAGQSCSPDGGSACVCQNRLKTERGCANLLDDDNDTLVDCADVMDCPAMTPCTAVNGAQTLPGQCSASGQCAVEFCFDNADNDGDTLVDCADTDCDMRSCNPDGGTGCLCTGNAKKETLCADRVDNDGDTLTDCADFADCPQGTACQRSNGTAGVCQANRTCN